MSVSSWNFLESVLEGQLHPGQLATSEFLLTAAEVGTGSSVLDVGCGAGGTVELAEARGAQAIGLDKRRSVCQMVQSDFNSIPFMKESFDVVVSECVLCLSPTLGTTLTEINRVMKPSGRLAFSDVVIEESLPELPGILEECLCLQGPRNQEYVCNQVSNAGFDIQRVHSHQKELIELRDSLMEKFDVRRMCEMLSDEPELLRSGIAELNAAIDSGNIQYISLVAEKP